MKKRTLHVCMVSKSGWSRTSEPVTAKTARQLMELIDKNFPGIGTFVKVKEGNKIVKAI